MLRFVILEHQSPRGLHWDFMLQREGSLATWALAREPVADLVIAAEALADHRLAYLDYEGPITGGRGTVVRWDAGTYEPVRWEAEVVVARLLGVRLCGEVRLEKGADHPQDWAFAFSPDRGGR